MGDAIGSGRDPTTDASSWELFRRVLLTGIAVVVPVLISLYVLVVAGGFLANLLTPIAKALPGESGLVRKVLAAVVVIVSILVVGLLAHFRAGKRALDYFDAALGKLPGIGTVYRSFRRMSDVMLESEADHFREVKLVAFPSERSYALGFETANTGEAIETAVGADGMVTLFVPMAPNPFMGGFVLHVPEEHVVDVDLTVEEGIRATVTSGVTVGGEDIKDDFGGEVWELSDFERVPDRDDLESLGLDIEEIRSLDVEDLRSLDRADVEERFLSLRDRLVELEERRTRREDDVADERDPDTASDGSNDDQPEGADPT